MRCGKGIAGIVLALIAFRIASDGYDQTAKEVVIGYTGPISGIVAE